MTQSIFEWAEGKEFDAISEEELKRFDDLGEFVHYTGYRLETLRSLALAPPTDREMFDHVREELESFVRSVHRDAQAVMNGGSSKHHMGTWIRLSIDRHFERIPKLNLLCPREVSFFGNEVYREQLYAFMRTCARAGIQYLNRHFEPTVKAGKGRGISIKNQNIVAISLVGYRRLSDVSPLAELPELQALHLQRTGVEDISPFYTSASLRILDVSRTEVPADQIVEIKERIPGLEVRV